MRVGEFDGIKFREEEWTLSHLFYENYAMILGKGEVSNVERVAGVL